ncbi:3-oxo-5-alpha-steroid 4-dehydrogenase-domain-containing protein [Kockovaella imperatae]|uniref:3-oxo-5-alpha-steroid 4-dehydrogenase-domain-containing protein n=1 Tax=Kockovaella imperatae TaxID=4999 RepID=A0A1Y1UII0_9TREE|nr:3-oxo-5-alpha-steroid 4-dehydrogenase-domain-containing protein [Kockovaella imperatae]ORX37799.1 3-oxo-5-alpha-steroid 4-dehydrogenase-domain-containing protein [Kockovaella imperatae]
MVSLTVSVPNKGSVPFTFDRQPVSKLTVGEVKAAIHSKYPKYVPNRQRLTIDVDGKKVALVDDENTLSSYGVSDGSALRMKDLGRQTGYKWLYIWEYAGVIFLNPLFLHFSHHLWGRYEPSTLQLTVRNLTILHFVKREFESIFIHTHSRPTLPLSYVFRNVLYYWGVVGILMGLTLYRPAYGARALQGSILNDSRWINFWGFFILICENLNFYTHYHLSTLRQPKGKPRKYPTGFGFGTAVCANYWFETLGVLGLLIMTGFDLGTLVYNIIAIYFMFRWSGQKYARYKKEFDPKIFPGKRYKFFPPLY